MKKIVAQLVEYGRGLNKGIFALVALLTAGMTWANYALGINDIINNQPFSLQVLSWYCVFTLPFALAHVLPFTRTAESVQRYLYQRRFWALLLVAPLPFALKMSATVAIPFSSNGTINDYWNTIAYWPVKLAGLVLLLFFIWSLSGKTRGFYGMAGRTLSLRPYFFMLLFMVPLIAAAATQPDFLRVYPKLQHLAAFPPEGSRVLYALLFELSYGSDFIGIELFFRGFLVLAFARWAGKDAILPMAVFYCTIHFGKPLGECISSFFGGIVLGVVTFHSRSIWGGLLVHLGIAWLMEFGGYLGNLYME